MIVVGNVVVAVELVVRVWVMDEVLEIGEVVVLVLVPEDEVVVVT